MSTQRYVTFEISVYNIKIMSLSPPYINLIISRELYDVNRETEFTIDCRDLIENLNILNTGIIIINNSFKLVECLTGENTEYTDETGNFDFEKIVNNLDNIDKIFIKSSYIEIPLSTPIKGYYRYLNDFSTKFFIDKTNLPILLRGKVTYSNENNLIIKRQNVEEEELMEINVDYLEKGYLDFTCSNNWIEDLLLCYELIDNILFCFSDTILCVKITFKSFTNCFMEIQIQERIQ